MVIHFGYLNIAKWVNQVLQKESIGLKQSSCIYSDEDKKWTWESWAKELLPWRTTAMQYKYQVIIVGRIQTVAVKMVKKQDSNADMMAIMLSWNAMDSTFHNLLKNTWINAIGKYISHFLADALGDDLFFIFPVHNILTDLQCHKEHIGKTTELALKTGIKKMVKKAIDGMK